MLTLIKTQCNNAIIDFLKTKGIMAFNLLGAIEHVPELTLYVDDLENPTGVVGDEGYFKYIVTDTSDFVDAVLASLCHKDDYYAFSGIDKKWVDYILSKDFKCDWRNDCYLYYLPEDYPLPTLDPRVQSLVLENAEEIDSFYEFRGDHSLGQIKDDIINRPSSCILVDQELASWAIIHRDDTMGIMYTKEKFRHQQLAYSVAVDLMHKVRALGKTPYVHILTHNKVSQKLAAKSGLEKDPRTVSWFGIVVGDMPIAEDD